MSLRHRCVRSNRRKLFLQFSRRNPSPRRVRVRAKNGPRHRRASRVTRSKTVTSRNLTRRTVRERARPLPRSGARMEAEPAYGGSQALNAAGAHPPAAIVLDLDMPLVDGLKTANDLLKAFPTTRQA